MRQLRDASPVVAALILTALYVAAFFPGAMGFDAAYQWWQSRGGETSTIHGMALTWLWRFGGLFGDGPAPLFLMQLIAFWIGVLLIAYALELAWYARTLLIVVVGICPIYLVLFSSVVSDAMLVAACTFGIGLLLWRPTSRAIFVAAMFAFFVAFAVRKNAVFAVLPLIVLAIHWRSDETRSTFKKIIAAFVIVAAMFLANAAIDTTAQRRTTVFAATALWDIAAISIETNTQLLPVDMHGPGLTIDDLRQAFAPYANTTIFAQTHAGIRQPFFDPESPMNAEVRDAWIGSIVSHPRAYLKHRLRLTADLFGTKSSDWPRELVYFPDEFAYANNPPVAPNTSALHVAMIGFFEAMRPTIFLAAWPYVLLAIGAAIVGWRRRTSRAGAAALTLAISALLYAAPLIVIAPSAELRYLGWTCIASLLATACAVCTMRSEQ